MKQLGNILSVLALLTWFISPVAHAGRQPAGLGPADQAAIDFLRYIDRPQRERKTVGEVLRMLEPVLEPDLHFAMVERYGEYLDTPMPRFQMQREPVTKIFFSAGERIVSIDIFRESPENFARIHGERITHADMFSGEAYLDKMEKLLRKEDQVSSLEGNPWRHLLLPQAEASGWMMPAAIVVAAGLIAAGVYFAARQFSRTRHEVHTTHDVNVAGIPTDFSGTVDARAQVDANVEGTANLNATGEVRGLPQNIPQNITIDVRPPAGVMPGTQ